MESTYIRMRRIIIKTLLRLLNQWQDNRRIHKRVFITITHKLSRTNTQYVLKTYVLIIEQLTRNQTQEKSKSNKQKKENLPCSLIHNHREPYYYHCCDLRWVIHSKSFHIVRSTVTVETPKTKWYKDKNDEDDTMITN